MNEELCSIIVTVSADRSSLIAEITPCPEKKLESDLQNILRQSYDDRTIAPMLRSTYDKRLI